MFAKRLLQKIVGLKFRPMSINSATNKIPTLGNGCVCFFSGNEYQTYINDFTYTLNVGSDISCFAETPLARLRTRATVPLLLEKSAGRNESLPLSI